MSSLNDNERRYLERLLEMSGGYVLDYNNTFGEFFHRHQIDIQSGKYQKYGTSKAKKLRVFWEIEPDRVFSKVLAEMLDSYKTRCDIEDKPIDTRILRKARSIVDRLSGEISESSAADTEEAFLQKKFFIPNVQKLPIEPTIIPIIEERLGETQRTLSAGAYLSSIILCGSILEAVLLGKAQQDPRSFNTARASPKTREGKVKQFNEWTLEYLTNVASEIGVLKLAVKKFSYGLREFRHYVHPYQQMISGFTPNKQTSHVCIQVLKAALPSVAGER